ncbi:hypothetical protein [Paraburkholderia sp. DGU8]|uniref:hypothetical protein n=1 Tax=Paraburkholderia sp. DGU8 TaxID=3161997 RepID=UPI003467BCD2
MKRSDFHIGLEFRGLAGFRWRCTDVGMRTIVAVQLDHDDPNWYKGPPYIAKEVVFDEKAIQDCHLTDEDAITAALHEADTSGHPGFPHEVVMRMTKARFEHPDQRYPHNGVLRFDRLRSDGEIVHPYAARKDNQEWIVQLYVLFPQSFSEMSERDFISLPIATAADVRARADEQ